MDVVDSATKPSQTIEELLGVTVMVGVTVMKWSSDGSVGTPGTPGVEPTHDGVVGETGLCRQ